MFAGSVSERTESTEDTEKRQKIARETVAVSFPGSTKNQKKLVQLFDPGAGMT